MGEPNDPWAAGDRYEAFMGRWSRRLAPRFVAWLRVPDGAHWLDVGCGTGALTSAICASAAPASVLGCDLSAPFVDHAQQRNADQRATFVVAGVGELPGRAGGYGAVASLLALNFFPDAGAALREMAALAAPGGVVGACVWDYAGGMAMLHRFWEAAVALDPAAAPLAERHRFPLCAPAALEALFRAAALRDVRCESIELEMRFASFDDFWAPMLGGTGPAPAYVVTLDATQREALARQLDATLPRAPDGTIVLSARAWAVRGMT